MSKLAFEALELLLKTTGKLTQRDRNKVKKRIPYVTKHEAKAWGKLIGNEAQGWGRALGKVADEIANTKLW